MKINWAAIGKFAVDVVEEMNSNKIAEREKTEQELKEQAELDASVARVMAKKEARNINRNDIDALRERVIEIISDNSNSYWTKSDGKDLLKLETRRTEEEMKKKYYEFIIDKGL